jgi:glucokinase
MKHIIGIDVGGTKIAACLVDPGRNFMVHERATVLTEAQDGKEAVLRNIFASIDRLLAAAQLEAAQLSGLGVALPGPVDSERGVVIECPNLPGWQNIPIRDILAERYRTAVSVDNDAKAATIAEAALGAGKNLQHLLYIGLGTGIACGIIIDGKLYRGHDGVAGELSHILCSPQTPLYKIASGKALDEMFSISGEHLQARYEAQDPLAREAFDHLITYLGIGIGNVVTLFNPEAIVLGGGLMNMGDFLLAPLEAEVRKNAFSISASRLRFLRAVYQHDAGAVGMSYVVWHLVTQDRMNHVRRSSNYES